MTRCSIGGKRVWWHKLGLASEFESDRWNRNAHWNNVVVKEFIYFCVSQVPSQKLWLGMCYVPSGSFPIAGSLRVYVPRVFGCIWDLYAECIREGEPRNPLYMDSTSVASPLIAEVIGGWGESFSLCLLSYSNPIAVVIWGIICMWPLTPENNAWTAYGMIPARYAWSSWVTIHLLESILKHFGLFQYSIVVEQSSDS